MLICQASLQFARLGDLSDVCSTLTCEAVSAWPTERLNVPLTLIMASEQNGFLRAAGPGRAYSLNTYLTTFTTFVNDWKRCVFRDLCRRCWAGIAFTLVNHFQRKKYLSRTRFIPKGWQLMTSGAQKTSISVWYPWYLPVGFGLFSAIFQVVYFDHYLLISG